jgi:5-(carboxyamino)imidazole ribonucleotide mutase
MPKGIPVATFAIGEPGAVNSALYVISLLAIHDSNMEKKLAKYRKDQTNKVLKMKLEK